MFPAPTDDDRRPDRFAGQSDQLRADAGSRFENGEKIGSVGSASEGSDGPGRAGDAETGLGGENHQVKTLIVLMAAGIGDMHRKTKSSFESRSPLHDARGGVERETGRER